MANQIFKLKPREFLTQAKKYAEKKVTPRKMKRLSRGIYLLPNLLTTAGLFAGFYAIVTAMKGFYDTAAVAIFIAMIADTLDGRVARFTHTQTAFGAEYDSLSDMVAFGIAPALVMYTWSLYHLGKIGWLISFLYSAGTALRLARFNSQIKSADKRYFQGLPCPAAAALVASTVWIGVNNGFQGLTVAVLSGFLTLSAALLMVSNLRYYSFKEFDFVEQVPFITVFVAVLFFVGVAMAPPEMLFLVFFSYAVSGLVITLNAKRKKSGAFSSTRSLH